MNSLQRLIKLAACLVVLKVTVSVVADYVDYLPPNFHSDFLWGRAGYFWRGYQWPFYLHIAAGPMSLVFGLILMSEQFRRRFSGWHRRLGRVQVVLVLLGVAPSGIAMAWYAQTGAIAGLGFASLGIATGTSAWLGWRSAVQRRFHEHRQWMSRCYILLCSAVVLRLMAGVFTVVEVEGSWTYPLAAWISWLGPWMLYECTQRRPKQEAAGPIATVLPRSCRS